MFLTMVYKKQNIVLTMPLTMLIAHPYDHVDHHLFLVVHRRYPYQLF